MIIPQDFDIILKKISNKGNLRAILNAQGIAVIDFFKHLDKYPEDKIKFETARQIAMEQCVDSMLGLINSARDKFDLDKAALSISTTKWLAEKLIPKTYGQRVDVNVNKTIDIRGILEAADKLVDYSVIEVVKNTPLIAEVIILDEESDLEDSAYNDILGEMSRDKTD